MSELKAMRFFEAVPASKDGFFQPGAFVDGYIKSEADKVIEELKARIAELEEERRWRKFPDEKPEHDGIYIVLLGEHTRTLDVYCTDKGKFRTYMPTAWLPLPSAPKEERR